MPSLLTLMVSRARRAQLGSCLLCPSQPASPHLGLLCSPPAHLQPVHSICSPHLADEQPASGTAPSPLPPQPLPPPTPTRRGSSCLPQGPCKNGRRIRALGGGSPSLPSPRAPLHTHTPLPGAALSSAHSPPSDVRKPFPPTAEARPWAGPSMTRQALDTSAETKLIVTSDPSMLLREAVAQGRRPSCSTSGRPSYSICQDRHPRAPDSVPGVSMCACVHVCARVCVFYTSHLWHPGSVLRSVPRGTEEMKAKTTAADVVKRVPLPGSVLPVPLQVRPVMRR